MSGMYQDGQCTAISCSRLATLEIIMEVFFEGTADHKPFSYLSKIGYCDDDFGFFYRKLMTPTEHPRAELVRVDVVQGLDDPLKS